MINGIKFLSKPVFFQKNILSQWMGCSNVIWNAKTMEDEYLRTFARKYLPIGTFPTLDQKYSQYKTELTPWLNDCPSQILRNSASNWYSTYQNFFKGLCGRPKIKKKNGSGSILLTKELFRFEIDEKTKKIKLFIGTKTNNIGYLEVKWHNKEWLKYGYPNSIRIKKTCFSRYTVSFCYENNEKQTMEAKEWFNYLRTLEEKELEETILGVDRGVNVICATDDNQRFNPTSQEKTKLLEKELKRKKHQKRMARQKKGSKRRNKTKKKIAKMHEKQKNIRNNICHKISKELVKTDNKVIVFENLKTKNMTKSASGDKKKPGKNVAQKSGLNKSILDKGWHKIESFTIYKAKKFGKIVFKIDPKYTSQECISCSCIRSKNRLGSKFKCINCKHEDHADNNAGKIIKKRTVKLFLHSGTELSAGGVLKNKILASDIVRRAKIRPDTDDSDKAQAMKRKKRQVG